MLGTRNILILYDTLCRRHYADYLKHHRTEDELKRHIHIIFFFLIIECWKTIIIRTSTPVYLTPIVGEYHMMVNFMKIIHVMSGNNVCK